MVNLLLAGLATPLVLSVHSIVSMDFATSLVPGWHTTIFPPYFVAGAIFSGFGMVLTLLIITRQMMHLERYITVRHLEAMAKVIAADRVAGRLRVRDRVLQRLVRRQPVRAIPLHQPRHRAVRLGFYLMVMCNVLVPQLLWSEARPHRSPLLFVLSLLVNVGMWFERFVIIVDLAAPRVPAVELGHVLSDGRSRSASWSARFGLFFTCSCCSSASSP